MKRGYIMKRIINIFGIICGIIIVILLIIIAISCILFSPKYMYRIIINGESKVTDYSFFDKKVITKSLTPYIYVTDIDNSLDDFIVKYKFKDQNKLSSLLDLLEKNDTTSMIIIHNDIIKYEEYLNNYSKLSQFR